MATQIDKATRSDAAEPLASVPLWINGQRTASTSTRSGKVTNASTGKVVRTVPFANAADIDAAVKAATAAFPEWRATPPLRRARILTRFRELMEQHQKELAAIVSEEHGKVFQVVANGVTGEMAGDRPWSWIKIALLVILALFALYLYGQTN